MTYDLERHSKFYPILISIQQQKGLSEWLVSLIEEDGVLSLLLSGLSAGRRWIGI